MPQPGWLQKGKDKQKHVMRLVEFYLFGMALCKLQIWHRMVPALNLAVHRLNALSSLLCEAFSPDAPKGPNSMNRVDQTEQKGV